MIIQDWTVRTIDGVDVIRVEGKDWTEVSVKPVKAGYPDEVTNKVLGEFVQTGHIEVVLGSKRYYYVEGEEGLVLETRTGNEPQRVTLQPYK